MRGKSTKQRRQTAQRKDRQQRALIEQGRRRYIALGKSADGQKMQITAKMEQRNPLFGFRFPDIAAYLNWWFPKRETPSELQEPGCGCARGIRNWRRYHARLQRPLPRKPILNPRKFLNSKRAMR